MVVGIVLSYTFLGLGLLIVISLPPRPLTVRKPTFGGPTCLFGFVACRALVCVLLLGPLSDGVGATPMRILTPLGNDLLPVRTRGGLEMELALDLGVFRVRTPTELRAFLTTFFPTFLTAFATFL